MIEYFIYTKEAAPVDVPAFERTLREAGWVAHVLRGWLGSAGLEPVTIGELRDDDSTIGYRSDHPLADEFQHAIHERELSKLEQWVRVDQLGYAMWFSSEFSLAEHMEFESLADAREQMGDDYADFLQGSKRHYIVTNCNDPEFGAAAMGAVAFLRDGLIEDPQSGISIPSPASVSDLADFLSQWPS